MGDFNSASFYGDDAQELQGPPGRQGDPGKQGDPGPRGEDGKDAFAVWADQGNTGSFEAFLETLKGAPGRDGKSTSYRFGSFAVADILSGEIILDHVVAEPCTFGPNFARCVASASLPPEVSPWVAEVTKNGNPIGNISINATGAGTLATVGAVAVPLIRGDIVTVTAPLQPDDAIGRLRVTFVAELPD